MNNLTEYRGLWYLPNNTENKIGGVLILEGSQKITLELFGCFDDDPEDITKLFEKKITILDTIHGITSDNKKITLFDCHEALDINSINSVYLSNYTCHYIIVGDHFDSMDGKYFSKISCYSPLLPLWKHPSIIRNSFSFRNQENTAKEVTVTADQDSYWEMSFDIGNNYQLLLNSEGNFNNNFERTKFEFTQTTRLSITNIVEKKSMQELLDKLLIGYNFITLATMSLSSITTIFLYTENLNDPSPITLCYRKNEETQKKISSTNFLFSFLNIRKLA